MKSIFKKQIPIFLVILFISISIGFFYAQFSPDFSISNDALRHYFPIAQNLSQGLGFRDAEGLLTSRVAPIYPSLLSLVYRFSNNFQNILIIQIFFLAGIGICGFLISKTYFNEQISFIIAMNIVFWPYILFYTKLYCTEIIFIFLLLISIYYILESIKKNIKRDYIIAGILLALATLTRPVTLLLPFWIPLLFCAKNKLKKEKFYKHHWIIFITAFILTISPWTIRNFAEFQTFIPVAGGLDCAISKAYNTYNYQENLMLIEEENKTYLTHISARIQNIYLFWNPGASGENTKLLQKKYEKIALLIICYKIIFLVTLALAFFSIKFFFKNEKIFALWIIIFYFWLLHIILFPYPRYTLPIIPLIIILSWFSAKNIFLKKHK